MYCQSHAVAAARPRNVVFAVRPAQDLAADEKRAV